VQRVLGHHSPAFTLATYVHLMPLDIPASPFGKRLRVLEGGNEGAMSAPETAGILEPAISRG
jgi:hypothetical protein